MAVKKACECDILGIIGWITFIFDMVVLYVFLMIWLKRNNQTKIIIFILAPRYVHNKQHIQRL